MDVQIPWLGVVLSTVAAMVIGMIWYGPLLGKQWLKMIGAKGDPMKENMPSGMVMQLLMAFLTALILAHFINYLHEFDKDSWMDAGLLTALWAWLGFGLTTIVAHSAFDNRDKKLMLINAGNRLVTLMAMGAILGASFK